MDIYDFETDGIIPTRVGTSQRIDLSAEQEQDHPHACGDKDFLESSKELERGSSPRVWGQAKTIEFWQSISGIIPTRVGTSDVRIKQCRLSQDHPHACGDKSHLASNLLIFATSSPRVWGQVNSLPLLAVLCRIIPTRVGTSTYKVSAFSFS